MKLFIYGAGGKGKEDYDLIMRSKSLRDKYAFIYFIDDFQEEESFYGTQRIRFSSCYKYIENDSVEFVIAVGEPSARKMLWDKVVSNGYTVTTLIDDSAIVSNTAIIEPGCIVEAGAIISSDVVLKENAIVMYNAIVGHDAVVGNNTVICPRANVGGNSIVGEQCFIGISSSIMQKVNVGDRAIIGMGAMAFRDVAQETTVIGNPARVTKGNAEHKVFK